MRPFTYIGVLLVTLSCTQKASESFSTSDTTNTMDSIVAETAYSADSLTTPDDAEYESIGTEFSDCLNEKANLLKTRSVYQLTASFSGYESSQDATYFFDSLYNPTYCDVSWSMEGSTGSYSYYFENKKLVAGEEENSYNAYDENTIFCEGLRPFVGLRATTGEAEAKLMPFTDSDFQTLNNDALNEYQRLLSRISEYADEANNDEGQARIHIENTVNYGEDYTETENFELDLPLFDALFR